MHFPQALQAQASTRPLMAKSPCGRRWMKRMMNTSTTILPATAPARRLEQLVDDAQTERRRHRAGQPPDAAQDDDHERVDDVALSQLGPDVAELRERHAAEASDPRAEAEHQRVDPLGRDADAGGHRAILSDRPDLQAESAALQDPPDRRRHDDHEADHRDARPGEHQPVRDLEAARQPVGVGDGDVLRAEDRADQLDETEADPPGGEQRLERSLVEVSNDRSAPAGPPPAPWPERPPGSPPADRNATRA